MKDQVDAVIENIMRKRLRDLAPDAQLASAILGMGGFDSSDVPLSAHKCVESVGIKFMNHNGGKRGPEFELPYDSPLEEMFAWNIVKYLDEGVAFQKQIPVDTRCGKFRLDFIVQRSGRSIGLECDGEEYHCSRRDEWRDAMILETGLVQAIYRFRGKDLFSNIEDCLFFLSVYEPQFFLERGLACLKVLASDDAKTALGRRWSFEKELHSEWLDKNDSISCSYAKYQHNVSIVIQRNSYIPVTCGTQYLKQISAFAEQYGGGDLDYLMKNFDKKYRAGIQDQL